MIGISVIEAGRIAHDGVADPWNAGEVWQRFAALIDAWASAPEGNGHIDVVALKIARVVAALRDRYVERLHAITEAVRTHHTPYDAEGENGEAVSCCATCSEVDGAGEIWSTAWPCATWSAVFSSEAPPPRSGRRGRVSR
jgi:hypothetical protein